ncbi:MAG: c-type cytochrome [Alphaproteobacteria bacterium]
MGFVLAALIAACNAAAAETPAPDLSEGAALYETHCAVCHGPGLEAQPGMTDLRAFAGNEAAFRKQVRQGRGLMPGFGGVFSDAELKALYAYIKNGGATPESD